MVYLHSLPLVAPATLLIAALLPSRARGRRPRVVLLITKITSLISLTVAVLAVAVLADRGPGGSLAVGFAGAGLGVRLDGVSATMMLLVAFVGWVVLRYSNRALDGDARQGPFWGWTLATLAAVLLLVLAGISCSWSSAGSRRALPAPPAPLPPGAPRRRPGGT